MKRDNDLEGDRPAERNPGCLLEQEIKCHTSAAVGAGGDAPESGTEKQDSVGRDNAAVEGTKLKKPGVYILYL